ncbi:MAG: DNA cytosine methyltransferase, partial [Staphylococcus simulans]|nr:DNA cytosine methyltransferase [Staphylococcus simulans]
LPARTMLTSEGSVNRSTHFLKIDDQYRTLTPIEAERLNGFPDNWTATMPDRMRFFCMGNALVVPLITRIGNQIEKIEDEHKDEDTFSQLKLF